VKDHAAIAAAAAAKKGKMTVEQFAASLGYIAVKLYDNVIVRQTGTVFECLPPEERDAAMRAALEVMMKKKVFPIAAALGTHTHVHTRTHLNMLPKCVVAIK
jgi:hypothetical protein